MIALAAFIIAVIAAAVVGLVLAHGNSYVLIAYGTTRVEFTLFIFIIIYILALVVGAFVVMLIRRVSGAPARFGRARDSRVARRSESMLVTGLTALAEGRLPLAERALDRAARGPLMLPALLAAARAAELNGAPDRRDGYLRRARLARPAAAHAVLLMQAEFDLAAGDYARARDALRPLARGRKAHPRVLCDLARAEAALGEHGAVLAMLDELDRRAAMSAAELETLAATALMGALAQGAEAPSSLWRQIPRDLRRRPALLRIAARANVRVGANERAAELLERGLAEGFDAPSVCEYAALAALPAATRLRRLEAWLDRFPDEAVLLREAGRVALELQLWGQAESYLERARQRASDPGADFLLGRLAEARDRQAQALAAYRAGLETAVHPPVSAG